MDHPNTWEIDPLYKAEPPSGVRLHEAFQVALPEGYSYPEGLDQLLHMYRVRAQADAEISATVQESETNEPLLFPHELKDIYFAEEKVSSSQGLMDLVTDPNATLLEFRSRMHTPWRNRSFPVMSAQETKQTYGDWEIHSRSDPFSARSWRRPSCITGSWILLDGDTNPRANSLNSSSSRSALSLSLSSSLSSSSSISSTPSSSSSSSSSSADKTPNRHTPHDGIVAWHAPPTLWAAQCLTNEHALPRVVMELILLYIPLSSLLRRVDFEALLQKRQLREIRRRET